MTTKTVQNTPGPWHLAHDYDGRSRIWTKLGINDDGEALGTFICAIDKRAGREDEDLANAHLIAAAPDLLAALVALKAELHNTLKLDVKKHYSLMVADAAAGTAITKATVA